MTTVDLSEQWLDISERFWRGRLPGAEFEIGQPDTTGHPLLRPVGEAKPTRNGGWLVRISAEFASVPGLNVERWTYDVLTHESIHVHLGRFTSGHGRGFRREAKRIGKQLQLAPPWDRDSWLRWPQESRGGQAYYFTHTYSSIT